jgi:peptidyl-prolyl cis-trans isomerase A (cyclophilin A)
MAKTFLSRSMRQLLTAAVAVVAITTATYSRATIVEFQTSQGDFQVNLYDQTTPNTVANFLQYIDEGHYTTSVIHRVINDFIVQGGGYNFAGTWPLTRISANAAVVNEPVYSNVKGTIAMAKLGGQPNSATDQWFFNLKDNSSNLDVQNSGFTVFGQVIGDGMAIIEKISQLAQCDADGAPTGAFDNVPMVDYSAQNCTDKATPGIENFVVINQIIIIDSSAVTGANLVKPANTLINAIPEPTPTPSSGGGSFGWLAVLLPLSLARKLIK